MRPLWYVGAAVTLGVAASGCSQSASPRTVQSASVQLGGVRLGVVTDDADQVCVVASGATVTCIGRAERTDEPVAAAALDPLDGRALLQLYLADGTSVSPLPAETASLVVGSEGSVLVLALIDAATYCGNWESAGVTGSLGVSLDARVDVRSDATASGNACG